MNANDATLTSLATAQTGSTVAGTAPNAPANPGFDLVLHAVAGSALGSCGAPYTLTISAIDVTTLTQPWPTSTLHQAFHSGHGRTLSSAGPDCQRTQTIPITVPGDRPGGPWPGTPCKTPPPWSAPAPRSPRSSTATPS